MIAAGPTPPRGRNFGFGIQDSGFGVIATDPTPPRAPRARHDGTFKRLHPGGAGEGLSS